MILIKRRSVIEATPHHPPGILVGHGNDVRGKKMLSDVGGMAHGRVRE